MSSIGLRGGAAGAAAFSLSDVPGAAFSLSAAPVSAIGQAASNANGQGRFALRTGFSDPGRRRADLDGDRALQPSVEKSTRELRQDVAEMPQPSQP